MNALLNLAVKTISRLFSILKMKKVFIPLILISAFVLLLTPLSLYQINNKVSFFINSKSQVLVRNFEKQVGLEINWEDLRFKSLSFSIYLENVTLKNAHTKKSKKNKFLNALNGTQSIQSIHIRPDLISLFFKKNIVLSKVKIEKGDIRLKTIKYLPKKTNPKTNLQFPIKKLIVKDAKLTLSHKNNTIRMDDIDWKIVQKSRYHYTYKTFVKNTYLNESTPFSLRSKGYLKKYRFYSDYIHLSNDETKSVAKDLEILFNEKGLTSLDIKSSGDISFDFINELLILIDKPVKDFKSLISYNMNLNYKKTKGYKGHFDFQSKEFYLQNKKYHSFLAKGRFLNNLTVIDSGFIKKTEDSFVTIKKVNLFSNEKPIRFDFTLEPHKIPLSLVLKDFVKIQIPVQADLNGSIHCLGNVRFSRLTCEAKNKSNVIKITNWKYPIMSFYDFKTDIKMNVKNKQLKFEVLATKNRSSDIQISGQFNGVKKQLTLAVDGATLLSQDTYFHLKLPLKGKANLKNGILQITKNKLLATGVVQSSLLNVKEYNLHNISSTFQLSKNKLIFNDLKGSPGKSNYTGSKILDFNKKESIVNVNFSFLDTEDLKHALPKGQKWPLNIKGTGKASALVTIPWNSKKAISFDTKGSLFNASIQKESFERVDFNISSKKTNGVVNNLSFKKGHGLISSYGTFDKNFYFDLNVRATQIPLESIHFLNQALPFNQSGLINLNLKATGPIKNLKGEGRFNITESSLYSSPAEDTNARIIITKKGFSLFGNVMNMIFINNFYYPFSKTKPIKIKANLFNLDLVKIFLAKNKVEIKEDYKTNIRGGIDLVLHKPKLKIKRGSVNITSASITKGSQWIKSRSPFSATFSNSQWILQPFSFSQNNRENLIYKKIGPNRMELSGQTPLSLFSIFFPFINSLNGKAQINLKTNQNLKEWNPNGRLKITNGILNIPSIPSFTNIESLLKVENSKITVSKFNSSTGTGRSTASGFAIYNLIDPLKANITVNFTDTAIQIPKDFLTEGSGSIKITGNSYPYLLSGYYLINSGNITKNFSSNKDTLSRNYLIFKKEDKKIKTPFQLKLKIKTQNPILINNTILNASIEGETSIFGSLKTPFLNGIFKIAKRREDNLILFRDQEFKINSGSVLFKNSPPDNPIVQINANTLFKEKSIDTLETKKEVIKEYNIFLTASGPAKNLNFSLESSPSLNDKEIISMLTLGVSSNYFDKNISQKTRDYSYQLLGSFLLQNSLNKEIKNTLGLDLNISPHINVLNEPVTKISLKRVWFDKLKTSFSRTIEEFPESDMKLKYDLSPNVSLTAFWENTEHIEADTTEKQKMGLDFEFNIDF